MFDTAKKPDPRAAKTGKDHTESNSGKAKADEGRARSKKGLLQSLPDWQTEHPGRIPLEDMVTQRKGRK
jgi:hypothetical protein